MKHLVTAALAAVMLLCSPVQLIAAATLRIRATPNGSVAVGEKIVVAASAEAAGPVWFRFRVRGLTAGPGAGAFQTIRDFGPETVLAWANSEKEGLYELEVAAEERLTGEISYSTTQIEITPRAAQPGEALVSALDHPLVFLYSAGPCKAGAVMSVTFQAAAGAGPSTETPPQTCDGVTSMNFYLAGLRAGASYTARHVILPPSGGAPAETGPAIAFETPEIDAKFAATTVLHPARAGDPYGVLLQASLSQPATATDLQGNLLWFYAGDINFITRPEAGGRFLGIRENPLAGPQDQIVRLFDLAGVLLKETNAARVSQQLAARGMRNINSFHHEARLIAGGKFLVLASTEQIMTDVQGEGDIDVLSDMILVLDSNLQVEWAWDAFDHLDVRRKATLGETCTPQGGGCPAFYLAPVANDWLHGNSLQLTPDGNILYSPRHQDWLVKIAYEHGRGAGGVMWRLGKEGDFQAVSDDEAPWFSHQHDGGFTGAGASLTVFDNGNIRAQDRPGSHSRAQVWRIDEATRKAFLDVNADLGAYSFALGSAHLLPGGGLHANLGWVPTTIPASARSVEVDAAGQTLFAVETARVLVYRSFRVKSLYSAPEY